MLRCLTLALCLATLSAAVLPEEFSGFQRGAVAPATISDEAVWQEYGLETAERAEYTASGRKLTVTAYRLKDPTGALAAFQWQRPADAASAYSSATTRDGRIVSFANYVLNLSGSLHPAEQQTLLGKLPDLVRSSPPPLPAYLPVAGRVSNSERYLLGAASLARFEPRISGSVAAFERGAEGQLARYRAGGVDIQLAMFSYPTPQMARERFTEFQRLADASVGRSGPIVIVAFPNGPEAEKLVATIRYEPRLTWTEHVPKDTPQDAAKMILAIMLLAGVLILASVLLGMVFGGVRIAFGRFGIRTADHSLTTLNIDSK
jgi:hypothetical protein